MTVGIIAEFNPFHNGHKYLISEAKRRADADAVVAVMSGEWVQRGGIAVTDKWTRARMALLNGADLVLELPVIYSMNTAQKFAYGAVAALCATGVVDTLAFGSESGDARRLLNAAHMLINEPKDISDKIKTLMSEGMSYPAARGAAYGDVLPDTPNDILAVEYLRAADMLGAGFDICAIERKGAAHDCETAKDGIASASKLRKMAARGEDISHFLPSPDFPVYDESALDCAAISILRSCGAEYLSEINDVNEGLENKFIAEAMKNSTVDGLCAAVKSKRYPQSRIRRIVWSALLGITKEYSAAPPSYLRVLGMTERGMRILKRMKRAASLPVIIKAADFAPDAAFRLSNRAEDIFALAAPVPGLRRGGRDVTVSPVIAK